MVLLARRASQSGILKPVWGQHCVVAISTCSVTSYHLATWWHHEAKSEWGRLIALTLKRWEISSSFRGFLHKLLMKWVGMFSRETNKLQAHVGCRIVTIKRWPQMCEFQSIYDIQPVCFYFLLHSPSLPLAFLCFNLFSSLSCIRPLPSTDWHQLPSSNKLNSIIAPVL